MIDRLFIGAALASLARLDTLRHTADWGHALEQRWACTHFIRSLGDVEGWL